MTHGLTTSHQLTAPVHYELPADVLDAFEYYDTNRSGFLDYLQLQQALQGYGFDATIEECCDLIRRYDDGRQLGKLDHYAFAGMIDDLYAQSYTSWAAPPALAAPPRAAHAYVQPLPAPAYIHNRPACQLRAHPLRPPLALGGPLAVPPMQYTRPASAEGHVPLHYLRSVLPSSIQPTFDKHDCARHTRAPIPAHDPQFSLANHTCDGPPLTIVRGVAARACADDGRGLLDAPRTRDALADLGCRLTLGQVAMLVRRLGSYLPGVSDATVTLAQFVALIEHVRHAPVGPLGSSPHPTSPLSLTPRGLYSDVFPSPLDVESGRPRWYGYTPLHRPSALSV